MEPVTDPSSSTVNDVGPSNPSTPTDDLDGIFSSSDDDDEFSPPESRFHVPTLRGRVVRLRKAKENNTTELPLTEDEFTDCVEGEREELQDNGQPLIYMVRAYRVPTHSGIVYEGKIKGSRESIFLDVEWLDDNYMGPKWRKHTILAKQCYWFRVAVLKSVNSDVPCTIGSAIKTLSFMGLTDKVNRLSSINVVKNPFNNTVRAMKRVKGFRVERLKSPSSTKFNPVSDTQPQSMYLLQVRGRHNLTGRTDNTHAFCVFNNLIFDVNHVDPLPLTRDNLHRCCVGRSWLYDSTVRGVMFTPTDRVSKYIRDHSVE